MAGKMMTLKEKLAIGARAIELRNVGENDAAMALQKTAPVPPFLAKIIKEKVGADYLIKSGWNLTEAEAEFGQGWLSR